jgi:hypothetical protein
MKLSMLCNEDHSRLDNVVHRVFQKEFYRGIPNVTVWRVLRKRSHLREYKLSIVEGVDLLHCDSATHCTCLQCSKCASQGFLIKAQNIVSYFKNI